MFDQRDSPITPKKRRSPNPSLFTLNGLLPHEELESTASQGGNHEEEAPPRRFDPSLALESSGKGGLGIWGLRRGRARERRAGHGEGEVVGEGEREGSLNTVGPLKTVESSSTGQTG